MILKFKSIELVRFLLITRRRYCDGKSLYQRDEEGVKPRLVQGAIYPEWRKPWIQREGEWYSKLSVFNRKNPSPEILNSLQKLPYLTSQQVKDWCLNMKVVQEKQNQKYLPERIAVLGSNLAALHFFIFRQANVHIKGSQNWLKFEDIDNLPVQYKEGYFVESVDCTTFHHNGIRYEGLQNLRDLNFLKWLCLRNNKYVDVWCLDRIAGQNGHSLEYLDVSGCDLSFGSIYTISRMLNLKTLIITDPKGNLLMQAALSMLELQKPNLKIKLMDV